MPVGHHAAAELHDACRRVARGMDGVVVMLCVPVLFLSGLPVNDPDDATLLIAYGVASLVFGMPAGVGLAPRASRRAQLVTSMSQGAILAALVAACALSHLPLDAELIILLGLVSACPAATIVVVASWPRISSGA